MIALWMAYAIVLAALLGAAAACADAVFRAARRASRLAWGAAMLASLALPAAVAVASRSVAPARQPDAATAAGSGSDAALAALLARARVGEVAPATDWPALDRPLLALWLGASAAAFGWLALSRRRLRRALRTWQPAVVRDEPVLVTTDVGPAVVGEDGGRIVLPTWALALDERHLALMLAHERAHLTARDPQLLTAAAVAAALMPWNPALWWQLRRLRLAVEIDCDRRVLRHHPDVPTYGALLLDVARRDAPRHPLPAAALSSATTSLERRIQTMTMRRPRHPVLQALAIGALGTALVVAACEAPHPTGLKPQTRVPLTSIKSAAAEARGGDVTDTRVRAAIREHIPALARGTGHAQMAWFVEDASGTIVNAAYGAAPERPRVPLGASNGKGSYLMTDTAKIASSTPAWMATIDPSTIASVDVMKLAPGRVAPDSTSVIWVRLRAPGAKPEASGASALSATSRTKEPPLRVGSGNGQPSGVGEIRVDTLSIRTSTAPASARASEPLYIIDGRIVPTGPDGKPALPAADRIETVDVLKGEAATRLYGDSASNGVVVIKTKP